MTKGTEILQPRMLLFNCTLKFTEVLEPYIPLKRNKLSQTTLRAAVHRNRRQLNNPPTD